MLTEREKNILQHIQNNPQISQQELADLCGIARSSVAVHISNLMKKGIILGKGYVLRHEPYILVIGGQNIDIYGHPSVAPARFDSTPGTIRISEGGVGHNIATNLSLLGENVKFITAFGDDLNAERLEHSYRKSGIDVSNSLYVAGASTSTYMFITNTDGDMEMAVSDMGIYEALTPQFLETKLQLLRGAALCIIDTNLSEETLQYIAESCTCPIFADTVSTVKSVKLLPIISKIHTLKPNRVEAELLTGVSIVDESSMQQAADKFLELGLSQVFISLGSDGVYAASSKQQVKLSGFPATSFHTTGAGDSFMAALAWGYRQGLPLSQSAKAGMAAALVCMESTETVNPNMHAKRITDMIS